MPTQIPLERPLASKGSIAVVRADGTLWMVDVAGRMTPFADAGQGNYGFPAWSPDGTKLASIRTSATGGAIAVFDLGADGGGATPPPEPRVIFQSATVDPFYLSWSPDGTQVSFLANDSGSLALRVAAADGSSVLDGTGPGAVIRTGSPLYFDWIDAKHLFAHIGTGAEAFLGEIDRAGTGVAPAIPTPGTFRSADVSHDGKYVGYVRAGADGKEAVVVAQRDATHAHSMPVFDIGAVEFSPTADVLAAIGSTEPVETSIGFPSGPLRLLDAGSGKVRTLLGRSGRGLLLVARRQDHRGPSPRGCLRWGHDRESRAVGIGRGDRPGRLRVAERRRVRDAVTDRDPADVRGRRVG